MKKFTIASLLILGASFSLNAMDKVEKDAEMGHPEPMLFMIDQSLEKNDFMEAAKLIARFKIRVRQDAACCTDKSAAAAMDALTFRQMTNPKFARIATAVPEKTFKKIFTDEVEWVEEKLQKDQLPSPEWIAEYGMSTFIVALGGPASALFIPQSQWKKERMKII